MSTVKKPKSLSLRSYYCLLVAALFAAGKREATDRVLEDGIKKAHLPERMFAELFIHLSLLLGFPTMLDGLARLRAIAPPSRRSSAARRDEEEVVYRRGKRVFARIYGKTATRLLRNLSQLHEIVPSVIVRDAYGRVMSRRELRLEERELINVAVLSIQRLDRQLFSHIRGALKIGVSQTTLRDVLVLAARVASTDASDALEMVATLIPQRKLF